MEIKHMEDMTTIPTSEYNAKNTLIEAQTTQIKSANETISYGVAYAKNQQVFIGIQEDRIKDLLDTNAEQRKVNAEQRKVNDEQRKVNDEQLVQIQSLQADLAENKETTNEVIARMKAEQEAIEALLNELGENQTAGKIIKTASKMKGTPLNILKKLKLTEDKSVSNTATIVTLHESIAEHVQLNEGRLQKIDKTTNGTVKLYRFIEECVKQVQSNIDHQLKSALSNL